MKKKSVYLIFIIFLFTSCMRVSTDIYYKVRKISSPYELKHLYASSEMTSLIDKVSIYVNFYNYKGENGAISVGMKFFKTDRQKKSEVKLLDKVKIIKDKRIIEISKIDTKVYENKGIKRTHFTLYLPEKLTGKIILDFGKVNTGDGEFKVPLMYLQRYKVTESNTLTEALLNEGGENIRFYHDEGWIEE